jgi:hypothetical protein
MTAHLWTVDEDGVCEYNTGYVCACGARKLEMAEGDVQYCARGARPCLLAAIHTADIAGQSLAIGDRVATLTPRYRYKLSLGRVVEFTPKGLKVQLDNPRWAGDGLVQLNAAQVVKVPSQ